MIKIDGSTMEGGGQILRQSMALSAILGKPISISKIRAGRTKGGLKLQHLIGLQLVEQIVQGKMINTHIAQKPPEVGTTSIEFYPFRNNDPVDIPLKTTLFVGKIPSAGSTGLLAQISLPVISFLCGQKTLLHLYGGTHGMHAPPSHFQKEILVPYLSKLGLSVDYDIIKAGFYPKGGAEVKITVNQRPSLPLKPFSFLERGDNQKIEITAFTCGSVPKSVGERMVKSALHVLHTKMGVAEGHSTLWSWDESANDTSISSTSSSTSVKSSGRVNQKSKRKKSNKSFKAWHFDPIPEHKKYLPIPVTTSVEFWDRDAAHDSGCGIFIKAITEHSVLGSSGLGAMRVPAESVGKSAALDMVAELTHGAPLDQHLQDQLIIFMALANGISKIRTGEVTLHTTTALHFAKLLTGCEYTITPATDIPSTNIITVHGIGFTHKDRISSPTNSGTTSTTSSQ